MEQQIETDKPKKMIGKSEFEKSLWSFVDIHCGKRHETVDHTWDDVLLDDGHDQVQTDNYFQTSSKQEGCPEEKNKE